MLMDIDKLTELQALIASLTAWSDWCESSDVDELKSRIVWPIAKGDLLAVYPHIALQHGTGSWGTNGGWDSSAVWQPQGTIKFKLWALDEDTADRSASYDAFAAKATPFVTELLENAQAGPLVFTSVRTNGDYPVVHSHDLDPDSTDEPHWLGMLLIQWGLG